MLLRQSEGQQEAFGLESLPIHHQVQFIQFFFSSISFSFCFVLFVHLHCHFTFICCHLKRPVFIHRLSTRHAPHRTCRRRRRARRRGDGQHRTRRRPQLRAEIKSVHSLHLFRLHREYLGGRMTIDMCTRVDITTSCFVVAIDSDSFFITGQLILNN